ncbi:MAG: Arc family DNA-binding protein [Myxococcaceae bacterium]|nr:Arc family DNA-binding protein [Myxococcaceae bacterium]
MAQLVVRNVESSVKERLRRRAKRHGRSMEEEVRAILRSAVKNDDQPLAPLGTRLARHFRGKGIDAPIAEVRGRVKPARFGR